MTKRNVFILGLIVCIVAAIYGQENQKDYHSRNIGILKFVPSGSFQRDNNSENVSIISEFHMSQHEITREQFLSIMSSDPSVTRNSRGMSDPVQNVNWYQAIAFCNKLSIAEGLSEVYIVNGIDFNSLKFESIPIVSNSDWDAAIADWEKNGYRLPTEMEWMWAAMGATSGAGYTKPIYLTGYRKLFAGSNSTNDTGNNGTNIITDYVWYNTWDQNSTNTTHPVGVKKPNELELFDMSGNINEWCWDWHCDTGDYTQYAVSGLLTDYRGASSGTFRERRGGSWYNSAGFCTVGIRNICRPFTQDPIIGFRVVRN